MWLCQCVTIGTQRATWHSTWDKGEAAAWPLPCTALAYWDKFQTFFTRLSLSIVWIQGHWPVIIHRLLYPDPVPADMKISSYPFTLWCVSSVGIFYVNGPQMKIYLESAILSILSLRKNELVIKFISCFHIKWKFCSALSMYTRIQADACNME